MKKIFTILFLTLSVGLWAEGKINLSTVYSNDAYSVKELSDGSLGYRQMISADIDFDIHNKYVGNDIEIIATKGYLDILDTFTLNLWQPNNFTLSLESNNEYLFVNQFIGKSNIFYTDIGLSVKYFTNVTDWFTTGADGFIGYVPVNKTILQFNNSSWDDGNTVSTKITLWCRLFNIVKVYAGMESIEYWKPGMPTFAPKSIRNTIGTSVEYQFKNKIGIIGSVDYYCQHPETSWGGEYASKVNRAKLICKIGISKAF